MFGNTIKLKMTYDEIRVLVFALNELRNALIEEGRYTDTNFKRFFLGQEKKDLAT